MIGGAQCTIVETTVLLVAGKSRALCCLQGFKACDIGVVAWSWCPVLAVTELESEYWYKVPLP